MLACGLIAFKKARGRDTHRRPIGLGPKVEYEVEQGPKGPNAANVRTI